VHRIFPEIPIMRRPLRSAVLLGVACLVPALALRAQQPAAPARPAQPSAPAAAKAATAKTSTDPVDRI
jgi:hypothetical protein